MQNTNNVANQKYQYPDDDDDYKEISIIKDRLKFMISIFKNTIKIFTKCIDSIINCFNDTNEFSLEWFSNKNLGNR